MIHDGIPEPACLTDEDLYSYMTRQGSGEKLSRIEDHLADCAPCRQNLADLLETLHPEAGRPLEGIAEPTEAELEQTIALIHETSRKEHPRRMNLSWMRWPMAAAAAIGFVALCFLGAKYLYEKNKSEVFYAQAKGMLEQSYTAASPSNLRLALPFRSTSTSRKSSGYDSLGPAENLFFQALAVRDNMIEARLGLGCIYLNESKFARARDEFQKVLDIRKGQIQALVGRGVAEYEEAVQASDPLQRNLLLERALNDFDAVLKLTDSAEARYDRIWTLFESGRHNEALQEIERYLSADPGSIWAEGLKGLRTKMQATRSDAVEEEVNRSARLRDGSFLRELARQAPYRMPAAIESAMRRSLDPDQTAAQDKSPSPGDLRWAAETAEAAYSASTGDHSLRAFIDFYVGLSPPERELKRSLDRKFQSLLDLYRKGEFAVVLQSSKPLQPQYTKIKDSWQLVHLHHLRGSSFYDGEADFRAAEAEYLKMYEIADRLAAPDLIARALGSLATIYGEQRRFDDSLAKANQLKALAGTYHLDSWQTYAGVLLGAQYRWLGQLRQALTEYTAALGLGYRLSDGLEIVEALEGSADVLDRLGRTEEAGAFYRLAVRQQDGFLRSQAMQPTPEVTVRRLNLLFRQGDLALRSGDTAGAEAFFRESLAGPPGMREVQARNRIGLAEVYLRTKRVREAEGMLEAAMATTASGRFPEIEWRADFMKGRILEETGHPREAIASFRQSIEVLERMREYVKPEDLRQSFLTNRYDPFKAIVSLLFQSAGDKQRALEFVDKAKSATLREHLRTLDSGPRSGRDSTDGKERAFATIEYFFAGDRLLIFATGREKLEAVSRDISEKELSRQVAEYLDCIRRNDSKAFTAMARRLYDELIAPIENHAFASQPGTLVILPDGPLHLLPFAGLEDSRGRFLIERTPVAFAPSRSVFRHCLDLGRQAAAGAAEVLLIDGSTGLPNARDELAHISRLYGAHVLVLGAKDLPLFGRAAGRSEIFHFSGHAVIQEGRPALMLQKFPREVYLDCQAIRLWRMPRASLVNLAGCSTGIGPMAEGEAPWGLIPAFLDAGAPAIIASLMPVDDGSTKRLSCRFYDLLEQGVGKAKALQMAQLALLSADRSASDAKPQSWIPYILVGNPQ
jgi:CHAT domain-containing protein